MRYFKRDVTQEPYPAPTCLQSEGGALYIEDLMEEGAIVRVPNLGLSPLVHSVTVFAQKFGDALFYPPMFVSRSVIVGGYPLYSLADRSFIMNCLGYNARFYFKVDGGDGGQDGESPHLELKVRWRGAPSDEEA